jgi:prepilin-type N-terminal cleavage/methylation domain-containing protein
MPDTGFSILDPALMLDSPPRKHGIAPLSSAPSIQHPASSIQYLERLQRPLSSIPRRAFTLIELLVVIAVISLLAAMIFPVTGAITRNRIRSKTRTEMEQLVTAIEDYKTKLGHYPPDNPGNLVTNQLYFELLGTTNDGTSYTTLDGSASIRMVDVPKVFGPNVTGFVNCNKASTGDEARLATPFLRQLKPNQYVLLVNQVKILTCSIPAPQASAPYPVATLPGANPWRYNSSNPTNNPNAFDLWTDVVIAGKTNRISNWSRDPLTVSKP